MSVWPDFYQIVAQTLIATSLLMALVLLLRAPVRRALGAGAAYALWLIPALRLVLPSFDFAAPALPTVASVEIMRAVAPATATSSTMPWLLAIWGVGAAAFALRHLVAYRLFLRRALQDAVALGDGIYASDAVAGPAAIGLLVPRILVPLDFAIRFMPAERALAIAHERTHHARGDLWANAAALGMLCLHWFNPLAWAAHRAFRSDQELSCDAAVIGRAGAEQRAVYAAAMVKSAWGGAPPFMCPMSRTGNLLRRLKMVKTHKTSRLASAGGIMTVGAVALAGLTMTATGASAADPVVAVEEIRIKRTGKTPEDAKKAVEEILATRCGAKTMTRFDLEQASDVDGGKKTSFITLCNKQGDAGGDKIGMLEKARANIASSSKFEPAKRASILANIDSAIAKAKAEQ